MERKGRADNKRVEKAVETAKRLAALQLPFTKKALIVSQSILPAALYGAPYAPPSNAKIDALRIAVTDCLWGPYNTTRSSGALLNIALPGHTHDPLAAFAYKTAGTVLRLAENRRIRKRARNIRKKYTKNMRSAGPIGTLLRLLEPAKLGWPWARALLGVHKAARGHEIRRVTKAIRRNAVAKGRPSFIGVGRAIDEVRTNEVWKSARSVQEERLGLRMITGAMFRSYPIVEPEVQCIGCEALFTTQDEYTIHTFWKCKAHEEVRGAPEFAPAMHAYRQEGITRCLALHGIIPLECKTERPEVIQQMLLAIIRRVSAKQETKKAAVERFPWNRPLVGRGCSVPSLDWHKNNGLKHFQGDTIVPEVLKWLRMLQWSPHGSVSRIELALDFEATTKQLILEDTADVRKRANRLAKVLTKLSEVAEKKARPPPIPGKPFLTSSLRSIGANKRIRGYTCRPTFASYDKVRFILEQRLATGSPGRDDWSDKLVPTYLEPTRSIPTPSADKNAATQKGNNTR
eukprot:TRINITY_DN340_c0_g4_i3.p1 TRINITY_DN340_c0_g4~~TRINITY_DN340_c0_g4_i3.p1  ORF type:complete len:516 (-),score=49.97 TRINITY_DN340_c0_g4_i3:56-1603(-)